MKSRKIVLGAIVIVGLTGSIFVFNHQSNTPTLEKNIKGGTQHYIQKSDFTSTNINRENLSTESLVSLEKKEPIFLEESLEEKFYSKDVFSEYVFLDSRLREINGVIELDENRLSFFQERVKSGVLNIEMAEEERYRLITDKPDSTPSDEELAFAQDKIEQAQQNLEYDILNILSPDEQKKFKHEEIKKISEYREKSLADTSSYMSSLLPGITEQQQQQISSLVETYSSKGSKEYRLGVTLQRYGNSPESLTLPNDIEYYEKFKNEYKSILNSEQQEAFDNSRYF